MSLATTIQSAVATAFNALEGLTVAITFNANSESYDASTGTVTETVSTTSIPKALFSKYKQYEIDWSSVAIYRGEGSVMLKPEDRKLIFPASALSAVPQPKIDTVTDPDGVEWIILSKSMDAAQALYILQVRKI